MRRHKYGAQKVTYDGIKFDSKAESERYKELKLLEQAGEIYGLKMQPPFTLIEPFINGKNEKVRALTYRADFMYNKKDGELVIEDVKGIETAEFKLKKKLFESVMYPYTITVVKMR